ncbi:cyclophilin-like protein [Patellaria atrata CBS 101060]|uniref:Cyclophilin-like protein n=1 Tax=Patellaria atrata CBS 101060 TaxID=1346257 RepID=A0A9P4VU61_9PEZI|nr:cyclophilin-like protein [Patellaria atrata CBS 101060]
MSSLYNLEPQPTAKVLLKTTAGDILFELFAQQTPLTSRNFIQLCLDGYYDNTIFHRLVPGFILQGGDPTGTGHGGESIYGEPFSDEIHNRLKFNRRGLLGMANSGEKNDNGSQFFITLGSTPELTGKNTMFGRIEGETIYNVMQMAEAELAEEGGDRPLYPARIIGTEILVNYFKDMIKRDMVARSITEEATGFSQKKKTKRKAGKALLSFGGDEGDEVDAAPVIKKPKFNPKLVATPEQDEDFRNPVVSKSVKPKSQKLGRKQQSPSPPAQKLPLSSKKTVSEELPVRPEFVPIRKAQNPSRSPSSSPEPTKSSQTLLERTNTQIAELKASMQRNVSTIITHSKRKKSALEAMIPETSIRGRKRGPGGKGLNSADEKRTLDLLTAFRNKLDAAPPGIKPSTDSMISDKPSARNMSNGNSTAKPEAEDEDEAALCDLHFIANCQSCTKWDEPGGKEVEDEDQGLGWMNHTLTFAKDRLGKDLEWKRKNEEELVVIDPREKAKELKAERKGTREERKI